MESGRMGSLFFAMILLSCSTQLVIGSGGIECEKLDETICAFAVSSSGMRCVLEKGAAGGASRKMGRGETLSYDCRESGIMAEVFKGRVETDACVASCGLDRQTIGISSDALLDRKFTVKLCSRDCYENCHNVVDLYFELAAAEGAFLPNICEAHKSSDAHRVMAEIRSSDATAEADIFAPATSPSVSV